MRDNNKYHGVDVTNYAAVSLGTNVEIRNLDAGNNLVHTISAGGNIVSLSFSPDGAYIACANSSGLSKIYETSGWTVVYTVPTVPNMTDVRFSPDGAYVAFASTSSAYAVIIMSAGSWSVLSTLTVPVAGCLRLEWLLNSSAVICKLLIPLNSSFNNSSITKFTVGGVATRIDRGYALSAEFRGGSLTVGANYFYVLEEETQTSFRLTKFDNTTLSAISSAHYTPSYFGGETIHYKQRIKLNNGETKIAIAMSNFFGAIGMSGYINTSDLSYVENFDNNATGDIVIHPVTHKFYKTFNIEWHEYDNDLNSVGSFFNFDIYYAIALSATPPPLDVTLDFPLPIFTGLNQQGDYYDNPAGALILANNLFAEGILHQSDSMGGYGIHFPADLLKLVDPLISERYQVPSLPFFVEVSGDNVNVKLVADSFGIASHNCNGVTFIIEHSDDGFTWNLAALFTPRINTTFLGHFTAVTAYHWRITMSGLIPPDIGYLALGKSLTLTRQVYAGMTPSVFSKMPNVRELSNPNGQFTGKQLISTRASLNLNLTNTDSQWYRRYMYPLQISVGTQSLFVSWRPDKYPNETIYGWCMQDFTPSNSGPRQMMSYALSVDGVIN